MSKAETGFESFDSSTLCESLSRAHAGYTNGQLSVGLLVDDEITAATIDESRQARPCGADAVRGPMGCVVKVMTGILALRAANEGRVDFDRALTEADDPRLYASIRGVTLRHMLSHSHGLDLSQLEAMGVTAAGLLDVDELGAALRASRPLFEPGRLYSYNNAGGWLAAALLERVYDSSFADLLGSKVLRPAGIDLPRGDGDVWCPALGSSLKLSVPEILRFIDWFLRDEELTRHKEFNVSVPPPGWCPERGACAGWKVYGGGWYGHHMYYPYEQYSLAVRAHFERRIAIVVAAQRTPANAASMTLIRLFGRLLPEFLEMRLPVPRSIPISRSEMNPCIGTYANQSHGARVTFNDAATGLQIAMFNSPDDLRDNNPHAHATLKPATDGAYQSGSLMLQFISPGDQGFTHLWNGRGVMRRLSF